MVENMGLGIWHIFREVILLWLALSSTITSRHFKRHHNLTVRSCHKLNSLRVSNLSDHDCAMLCLVCDVTLSQC